MDRLTRQNERNMSEYQFPAQNLSLRLFHSILSTDYLLLWITAVTKALLINQTTLLPCASKCLLPESKNHNKYPIISNGVSLAAAEHTDLH